MPAGSSRSYVVPVVTPTDRMFSFVPKSVTLTTFSARARGDTIVCTPSVALNS